VVREESGNLLVVREKSGNLGGQGIVLVVREKSGNLTGQGRVQEFRLSAKSRGILLVVRESPEI